LRLGGRSWRGRSVSKQDGRELWRYLGWNGEVTYPYSLGTVMVTEGVKLMVEVVSMYLL